jgi:hypothetical protein
MENRIKRKVVRHWGPALKMVCDDPRQHFVGFLWKAFRISYCFDLGRTMEMIEYGLARRPEEACDFFKWDHYVFGPTPFLAGDIYLFTHLRRFQNVNVCE